MHSIDDYLDTAKNRLGLPSDRQLGFHLGLKGNIITQYRTRRAWPNDESMVKIADAAGLDPETALLELAYWRTMARHEMRAAQHFLNLIERAAPALLIAALTLVFWGNQPANAASFGSGSNQPVYIMESFRIIRLADFLY